MVDFERLITGQPLQRYPGDSHNAFADGELARRAAPGDQPPDPPPERKSPLSIVLVWQGAAPLDPGQMVKLGEVLATPTDDPSVPYSELRFNCSAFGLGDDASTPYAVTIGPLFPGEGGHGFIPEAWWAQVYINDETHKFAKQPASGSTMPQSATAGLRIVWKETGAGIKWAVVQMLDAGVEKPRAIRGKWVSGTTTLLINNVVALDSGTDPRVNPADATETVSVVNVPASSFGGGDDVYADWSAANNRYEARPKSSGSEKPRALRGTYYSGTTTLIVKNLVPLDSGTDPRTNPADATEPVNVVNLLGDVYESGDIVVADWNAGGGVWEARPLVKEKYRLIRGQSYGLQSGGTILIRNVFPLASGRDPTGGVSTISVRVVNTYSQTFLDGQFVDAAYSPGAFITPPADFETLASAGGSAVQLVNFIYHSATKGPIEAATSTAGPTVAPVTIDVEPTDKNPTTGKLEPTGRTIQVEYREGKRLDQLPSGLVYTGEALQIGLGIPVVLIIYCTEWSESGGG